jgi:hypothetical protein
MLGRVPTKPTDPVNPTNLEMGPATMIGDLAVWVIFLGDINHKSGYRINFF